MIFIAGLYVVISGVKMRGMASCVSKFEAASGSWISAAGRGVVVVGGGRVVLIFACGFAHNQL
jgi:hypothetical protein